MTLRNHGTLRAFGTTLLVVLFVLSLAAEALAAGELEKAKARSAELQARISSVSEQLEDVAERVDEAHSKRATLERDVASLEGRASQADQAMVARAVLMFKRGDIGVLEQLIMAGGPAEALERSRLLGGLGRQERETMELAQVARLTLAQRRAELDRVVQRLESDQRRLATLRGQLNKAFADAKARQGELASRRNRQRRISRSRQHGVYSCPLGRPFHFRDTWGAPRSGGRRHKGVDMFAPMNTPVYAMTNGVIGRHSRSRLGGIGLYLRGDDGNSYYYAHLRRIAPGYGPGRRVDAGELIAYNGDTGNARGGAPHVHFEVHPGGGRAINPYPFVAPACF